MTPLTFFLRTVWKTSAIFLGVTIVFVTPSLQWSAPQRAVTAQKSPTEAAVDGLMVALKDKDEGVRKQAAWALEMIRATRAVPALADALKDESAAVRRTAAHALGELRDASAIPALTAALKDDDASVRRAAIHAIAELSGGRR